MKSIKRLKDDAAKNSAIPTTESKATCELDADPEVKRHYYDAAPGTKLKEDRSSKYWLGPIVAVHELAEYGFLEYRETDFHSGPRYGTLTGRHKFPIYINGHSISRSGASLDEALIIAVAYKRDGINSQAARFFIRATEPVTAAKAG